MLKEQKVFDTSIYTRFPDEIRGPVILEDLAGLAIEAGKLLSLEERINPRKLEIIDGQIVDPNSKEPVANHFKYGTEFDRKESRQAELFYGHLVKTPPGALSISISPSGGGENYLEARVNVGIRKRENEIELYGIPSHLSPISLMFKAIQLAEHSPKSIRIDNPEDLREISIPVEVPEGQDPWEFLEEVFPLDSHAWETITEGKPWKLKEEAKRDGKEVAENTSRKISFAITEFDFIRVGASAEQEMAQRGWEISSSACTGALNSDLLNTLGVKTDAFGNERLTVEKWDYHTGNCANCGARNIEVGPCEICKACEKIL